MTPDDLRKWRADLGLTQREAAARLGYGLTQYSLMERRRTNAIPLVVALACSAVSRGLEPFGSAAAGGTQ